MRPDEPTGPPRVRVGIGGWSYPPWRKLFYPAGTAERRQLEYASRQVTSIEINSTFYRLQAPETFARWRDCTPADFVFSIKAPRFVVQRGNLASADSAIERFMSSGLTELGPKLGPILWQLAPAKRLVPAELDAFLTLLPAKVGNLPVRHALEVRHASFGTRECLAILREHGVAAVFADDAAHPSMSDLTSTFVYARLRCSRASIETGYPRVELKGWARRAAMWAKGGEPADLPRIGPKTRKAGSPRDVFVYFIGGAKERNPAAARELISLLPRPPSG